MIEHSVVHRKVSRRADQAWVGTMACSCGWTIELGPYEARSVVSEGLEAERAKHDALEEPPAAIAGA